MKEIVELAIIKKNELIECGEIMKEYNIPFSQSHYDIRLSLLVKLITFSEEQI